MITEYQISLIYKGTVIVCDMFNKNSNTLFTQLRNLVAAHLKVHPQQISFIFRSHEMRIAVESEEDILTVLQVVYDGFITLRVKVLKAKHVEHLFEEAETKLDATEEEEDPKKNLRLGNQVKKYKDKHADELREVKRQAKVAKRLEKYGVETTEELKQIKQAARLAKQVEKYGCSNAEELDQLKRAVRLAKQCDKYGCQNADELKELKKSVKLRRMDKKVRKETRKMHTDIEAGPGY